MKPLRMIAGVFAVLLLAVVFSAYSIRTARSSDHQDSPTVVNNPMEDITDAYVFPAPDNPNNVVFVMNFCPLIPVGCNSNFDPNVLYQLKLANVPGDTHEHLVIQMKANGGGTSPTFTLYGPAAPNQVGGSSPPVVDGLVAPAGTFNFNSPTTLGNGIQVFVGPRHDPFFFDLAQFFKIIPDRNYKNQPNPPPPSATSFNFPNANAPILDVVGQPYPGTAGSNGCNIAQPSDLLTPYNVMSLVVSVPRAMLVPSGAAPGKIGFWTTASTPSGS